MIVSADLLRAAGVRSPDAWAGPLTAACQANDISTTQRLAGFLANVLAETACLATLVESMDYAVAALPSVFGQTRFPAADAARMGRSGVHPADQRAIAERAYGGRLGNGPEGSGDGWLFRGHGGLQTTFRDNYVKLAAAIHWAQPVEQLPAYLATVPGACNSAAIFWRQNGCNALMDVGSISAARIKVNGGTNGMAAVTGYYAKLCGLLTAGRPAVSTPPAPVDDGTAALNDAALAAAQGS